MDDNVNHPAHYAETNLCYKEAECIDLTRHLPFCVGNAVKYIWRAGHKGNWREDLAKAKWYWKDPGCHTTFEEQAKALFILNLYDIENSDTEWFLKIKLFRLIIQGQLIKEIVEKAFDDLEDYFVDKETGA
ncbi:MAG: DUF3310 domain-containing protein [Victivallales bacterium]|nr:DUF3310 domain-containing protein [Victivallales bacterium]